MSAHEPVILYMHIQLSHWHKVLSSIVHLHLLWCLSITGLPLQHFISNPRKYPCTPGQKEILRV